MNADKWEVKWEYPTFTYFRMHRLAASTCNADVQMSPGHPDKLSQQPFGLAHCNASYQTRLAGAVVLQISQSPRTEARLRPSSSERYRW